MTGNGMLSRMVRASALDAAVYEEVEADQRATGQALLVILLSALAAGIGSHSVPLFAMTSALALVGWFLWALVTYLIGTRLLPQAGTRSNLGEMLRVTGFSAAPGILRVLGIVRFLNTPVFLITGVWMVVTMIVAMRHALDYTSTARAIVVAIIGWLVFYAFGILAGTVIPLA